MVIIQEMKSKPKNGKERKWLTVSIPQDLALLLKLKKGTRVYWERDGNSAVMREMPKITESNHLE